ncbi:MAG: corrinoid protein [Hyphomicrobiaceae bacterium]|nr:corrinoid protein [Hyphomicrobiaceae bacterium]
MTTEILSIIDPVTGGTREISGPSNQIAALRELIGLVERGDHNKVPTATEKALETGLSALEVLMNGLQAGLAVVGERFKRQKAFIPEVLMTARAMKAGMPVLKPLLTATQGKPQGVVVLGTVKGDLHDVGRGIVGTMMEGAGFQVHDVGVNVAPEVFIAKIKEVNADIIGMSALLSTTMMMQKATIQALRDAGMRDTVKVMSGGAPVTAAFAEEVGADGWAPDALTAVEAAKVLMGTDWNGKFVSGAALSRARAPAAAC